MNKRAEYTEVNQEQESRIDKVRYMFSGMYDLIEQHCQPGRETSLAITKLEEAQFWAIKGISREKMGGKIKWKAKKIWILEKQFKD